MAAPITRTMRERSAFFVIDISSLLRNGSKVFLQN
jgi:hypothetical protein